MKKKNNLIGIDARKNSSSIAFRLIHRSDAAEVTRVRRGVSTCFDVESTPVTTATTYFFSLNNGLRSSTFQSSLTLWIPRIYSSSLPLTLRRTWFSSSYRKVNHYWQHCIEKHAREYRFQLIRFFCVELKIIIM